MGDDQPNPDIVAALQVIEKLRETHKIEISGGAGGWLVEIKDGATLIATAGGPLLLDCICRAALAARK